MTRRRVWWGGSALIALALCGAALLVPGTDDSAPQALSAQPVTRGDIEQWVMATGVLKPSAQVNVGVQVNGQLKKLYVKQGERVKTGQLLAEIDPTLQQNDLRNAKAELNSARAQKISAEVLLKQYEKRLRREQKMARESAGVPAQLEEAEAQYYAQREQIKISQTQITQAEVNVETAEANLGYTRIVAPIDGEVLGIIAKEGQTLVSSDSAPTLMVLGNLDVMEVHTRISETDILKVQAGQPLWSYVQADPDTRYDSTLDYIQSIPEEALQQQADSSSSGGGQQQGAVYYSALFTLKNPARRLKTAMTAQVFIRTALAKQVLRLPLAALGKALAPDRYQVSVIKEGVPQVRDITVGISDRNLIEVKSGLQEGELVALVPQEGAAS